MARKWMLFLAIVLSFIGLVWAQGATRWFVPVQQIGEPRPQGIEYDPAFDQLVMVDLEGRLLLADAATFTTQHILYEEGAYNAYAFSHDGRWLALAIDLRVELWDTETGQLTATFAPDGAKLVQGPLLFSPDDTWLLLDTVVPAPQATRRSENDTEIIPWLWDLQAARDEGRSRLRGRAEAFAFFNYRNGLVMAGDLFLVAGQPSRLQIIDGRSSSFDVIAEIPSTRAEQDPIFVWQSANSDLMYIDPRMGGRIVQLNTKTGALMDINPGADLNWRNLESMQNLNLGESARVLCGASTLRETPLLRLLYGEEYLRYQNYEPANFMLIDVLEPLSTGLSQHALLIYNFIESQGRGSLELIYPRDTQRFKLSPDGTRLMVRRTTDLQPIEIYNLDTCALERTLYPVERDETGTHLLDYRVDGNVIVSDFQRFDSRTGATLAHEDQYTNPFDEFRFSADGKHLYTYRGQEMRVWDTSSGQLLQQTQISLDGEIIARSDDGARYLMQNYSGDIEYVDVPGNERRKFEITWMWGAQTRLIPSPDWQRIAQITEPEFVDALPSLSIYDFDLGQILHVAGADLPPEIYDVQWVDNQRVYVSGPASATQPDRLYGLDYHASGLPVCLVKAFPEDYTAWLSLWEGLTLRLTTNELGTLTQRICAALPETADGLIPALTPTPRFEYRSLNTPVPFLIPGVPACLTRNFRQQSVDYATLWREITTGLDEERIAELETMICEGLISSPFQVAATPTSDPNLNIPPTATAVDGAPQTTDYTQSGNTLYYTIDVLTGARFAGRYQPELVRVPQPDINLVNYFYGVQFQQPPTQSAISQDGAHYAVADAYGFVTIYRLTQNAYDMSRDEQFAVETRRALEPRSIGLAPTATEPFRFIGEVRPTLTPTITPTLPPTPDSTPDTGIFGQIQDLCPVNTLYTVDAPPSDFDASGQLFTLPPEGELEHIWVLDPQTGAYHADARVPKCALEGNCAYSPDAQWLVRTGESFTVSRADGSQETVLFSPEEQAYFPQGIRWIDNTTFEYGYPGYLTEAIAEQIRAEIGEAALNAYSGQITLYRTFDVTTGIRSEPFVKIAPSISIEGLPTSIVSRQPGDGPFVVVTTPYTPSEAKYYLYDLRTDTYIYLMRSWLDSQAVEWSSNGRYLYYRLVDEVNYASFDTQSGEQHFIGTKPMERWSPDGRYIAEWIDDKADIATRELPFRLQIWDSETGSYRRYCIPQSGIDYNSGNSLIWSPDSRYVAFMMQLPPQGDVFPEPTPEVGIIAPTSVASRIEGIDPEVTEEFMMPTPTPTLQAGEMTPLPPKPSDSTVTLEDQYQFLNPRVLILDTQTGAVTFIRKDTGGLLFWMDDGGSR